MRTLSFSDIHYAALYPGGIRCDDVLRVEQQFTDLAVKLKVDVCFFAGDRFLSHTPEDWVRVLADGEQRRRNILKIPTFSLVGNHDWWGKTHVRGHSNRQAQYVWGDVMDYLVIMDELKTYTHPAVPGLFVHALPAEMEPNNDAYDFSQTGIHVLLFHGCIKGALLDDETNYRSPRGIPLEAIDDPRFNVVLGGDLHIPQRLPFKHTQGGYIGACIQQTRRDRGEMRSFLEVNFGQDGPEFEFHDALCPRFVDIHHKIADGSISADWLTASVKAQEEDPTWAIVTLFLHGDAAALEQFHVPTDIGSGVRSLMSVRKVTTATVQPKTSQYIPMETATPHQLFEQYLAVNGLNLNGLDPKALLEKASKLF